jgi:hypothetical protein
VQKFPYEGGAFGGPLGFLGVHGRSEGLQDGGAHSITAGVGCSSARGAGVVVGGRGFPVDVGARGSSLEEGGGVQGRQARAGGGELGGVREHECRGPRLTGRDQADEEE